MQDDLHRSDVHHTQPLSIRVQFAADWHLREGEAVLAPLAAKARITRLVGAFAYTPEEGLKR